MEKNFKKISKKIRLSFINLIENGLKFHIGGTASCIDMLVVLFYGGFINLKKKNRSKFILSKGHALGALYSILLEQKLVSRKKFFDLINENKIGGQLDIFNLKKFIDWNTGSLGHSIGVTTGFALANPKKKFWTMIGDAEIEEGSVWEGIFFLSEKNINNVIIIIDYNKISASKIIDYKEVLDSKLLDNLNINIIRINGHNHSEIYKAYNIASKTSKMSIIIADTIKGKGFGIAENNLDFNNNLPDKKTLKQMKKGYENI